ncbi:MAG TPA: HAD family phosphatase [Aquiluna sp.]
MSTNNFPAAVLWDMDGTLIDSEPYWMESEGALAQSYGGVWTDADAHSIIGKSLYDSSAMLKERFGIDDMSVQEVIDKMTNEVIANLKKKLPFRPGAIELLVELKRRGIKTALVTMSMRSMAQTVADAIGFDAFDVIVSGDEVKMGKPHPEPYLKAAQLLGVDISDCIAFEDSATGMMSAESAGAHTIGVPNLIPLPARPTNKIISSLTDVDLDDIESLRVHV